MIKSFSTSAPVMSSSALQQEIESLSEEERKRVIDDLYGEGTSRWMDTPQQRQQALDELQSHVDNMEQSEKIQYNRALCECPDYVNDPAFRLQFLR
jgi:hypothetical protein